jgi:ATP/maltotriose-dependent transcriptional regulator MalT
VTFVSAPAGYGKTFLLTRLVEEQGASARVAGLSADEEERDPARFAHYLGAALHHGCGDPTHAGTPTGEAGADSVVATMLQEAGGLHQPLLLWTTMSAAAAPQ